MKRLSNKQITKIITNLSLERFDIPEYPPMSLVKDMMNQYGLSLMDSEKTPYEYQNLKMITTDTDVMIHNINHYRIACSSRRHCPEFGLGASPGTRCSLVSIVPRDEALLEEDVVLAYDMILAHHHNYQLGSIGELDEELPNCLQILYAMGLINKDGIPIDEALRPEGLNLFSCLKD